MKLLIFLGLVAPIFAVNPDAFLSAPELLQKYGYPVEIINITTTDGYILTIHRVPYGKKSTARGGPVVVLDHGLLSSSVNWILAGPEKSLAYILADAGYDVWLMNNRGNTYSRKHRTLCAKDLRFWEFDFHEQGVYDLPAVIDKALATTGQRQVHHVGYDLAGSKILVLLSMRPEYNAKVKLSSLMGPKVYGNNMRSPVRLLGGPVAFESIIFEYFGHGELIPELLVNAINAVAPFACTPDLIAATLCEAAVYLISGIDPGQANTTLVPVILGHQTSTSTRTFIHMLQSIKNKSFRQMNFGVIKNMALYHQPTPPDYPLEKVKVPFSFVRGDNDLLADTKDINRLAKTLTNVVSNYRVPYDNWSHVDFTEGIEAPRLAYAKVMEIMKRYD